MAPNIRNLFDLTGKVAIVSGGAQGLGEAIATALTQQGATTVICDINIEAATATADRIATETDKGRIQALECDIRDDQQVQSCVKNVLHEYGRIDVLVNNAGVHRRVTPTDYSQADIDAVFQVNLLGSFYMASAVGRVMIEQRSGSIINVSALGGGIVGLGRGGSIYGMTKGGIVAMTRDLAAEWGKYSVRVNALAPGWIRTPMTEALQQNKQKSAKVMERVPLGRWGEANDVAGAALFLASDASQYITGHTISIDGGAANVIAISEE
jgi:NAD(P)-dependent dehydrogenase (short-subunit alcohol dehydrogenase family)